MTSLCLLASYPRSGNTYVRALLANYLSASDDAVRLKDLPWLAKGEHMETVWRDLTGAPPAQRTLEQEWGARAAYFERMRKGDPGLPVLVKTHTVNASIGGVPAFSLKEGDRAIYVLRHPCDVAVSWADFYGKPLEAAVDDLLAPGRYIRGVPDYGYELTGSWGQHVTSWSREGTEPLLVRYQDLCYQPAQELRRMTAFLGLEPDANRIFRAVEHSSFRRLQQDEAEHGFAEAPTGATSGRFFREGRTGQWREVMREDLADRLYEAYGALIERFDLDAPSPAERAEARLQAAAAG